jgi:hypothetical protein
MYVYVWGCVCKNVAYLIVFGSPFPLFPFSPFPLFPYFSMGLCNVHVLLNVYFSCASICVYVREYV